MVGIFWSGFFGCFGFVFWLNKAFIQSHGTSGAIAESEAATARVEILMQRANNILKWKVSCYFHLLLFKGGEGEREKVLTENPKLDF